MLYLDTSLLTALVVTEPRSARARAWAADVDDSFMTSDWGLAEAASALSIRQRTGELTEATRAIADRALARFLHENVEVVAVRRADYHAAATMSAHPLPPLRAADALHLAVAARHGAVLHTLDDGQAEAGRGHGIDAVVTVKRG